MRYPCSIVSSLVLMLLYPFLADARAARPERPNVIVLVSDDQGYTDAGCYGARDLVTPHLDFLAARGVRFQRFYAAAPVCSPSRAGLLTGRYPLRCGVVGNAPSQRDQEGGLPPSEITMAEMFHAAGYHTALVGKWHLGYRSPMQPTAQGFDHAFGHLGGCIDSWSHFCHWSGPSTHDLYRDGKEVYENGAYFPDLMVREATTFLKKHRDQPFFLYFALNVPHYPYQPDSKWLQRYRDLPEPRRHYAAFVSTMDDRIGRLLASLDELRLRDSTIVVFQSDHGYSTEERAGFGGGSAGRLRGAKFSLFEGGIRVPALLSWPGHVPEQAVRSQVCHGCDWMPTLAQLCGIPLVNKDIDGKSLVEVLKSADAPAPHDALHWQVGSGKQAQWSVRQGDWVLIGNAWDTSRNDRGKERIPLFLSDLAADETQRKNLADQHPEIVDRLRRLHEGWRSKIEK